MAEKINKQVALIISAAFATAVTAAVVDKKTVENAPFSNDQYCVLKTDLAGSFAGAELRADKSGKIRYIFIPSVSSNIYEGVAASPRLINAGANEGKVYYAETGDDFVVQLSRKACVSNGIAYPIIATVGSNTTPAIK